jgi:hypothetical protein
VIVGQGTSSDPGPAYLGSDELHPYVGRFNRKRDIGLILRAAIEGRIPFIFSGGSPSGCNLHLAGVLDIVNELARENGWRLRIAVISGEIDKNWLKSKLRSGARASPLASYPGLPEVLSEQDVDRCKVIVAQMGPEPMIEALKQNVDGVITGRAVDVALYMAFPLLHGFDKAVVAHMAKTIECGGLCAEPPIADNVFAILRRDHFIVFPLNPRMRCTVTSVASHAFYERPDIFREENPGGYLDITGARFEQVDERSVRVSGARWVERPYTVKLEGVELVGYRTITLAGIRDPVLLAEIDGLIELVRRSTLEKWKGEVEGLQVEFMIFGKDAVLGPSEPNTRITGHEACVVASALAPSQELATAVMAYLRGQLLFADYPGRTSTAGNVAIPFSPGDIPLGPTYVWRIWHALELQDPLEPFHMRVMEFPCEREDFAWLTDGRSP